MGDRAHVYIHEGITPGVWIYTHWSGTELPDLVSKALASPSARARWGDTMYLTRIVTESLLAGASNAETGWGIGAQPGDTGDGHRVVDVDTHHAVVTLTTTTARRAVGLPLFADGGIGWPDR